MNVIISTFPGLSQSTTKCLPMRPDSNANDLLTCLATLLPSEVVSNCILTTSSNERITNSQMILLSTLARTTSNTDDLSNNFLTLRLSAPLVGGKGGFGSQLRAAGGRMSSRKRKQNAELALGSARNLDGRRLRTVAEAKNLATYLATKPEMDRKEKEVRRKRWEQVIELAEQREADMRAGKTADGRRKGLSEEWLQEKEDVGDSVKNAVKIAMAVEQRSNLGEVQDPGSDQSPLDSEDDDSDDDPMELEEDDMLRLRKEAEAGDRDALWVLRKKLKIPSLYLPKEKLQVRRFTGFDDDLTSESEDEGRDEHQGEDDDAVAEESAQIDKGKGKASIKS